MNHTWKNPRQDFFNAHNVVVRLIVFSSYMINSGHHAVVPPGAHSGPVIPPASSGRHELKTPTNASVRASSVSAAKQERLEALRSERHRIMQMQTTILSRPRSVAGTPQAPIRSPAVGPRANPQPLVFQTHASVPQDGPVTSNALSYEIDQLKQEISRLKIEVDRYRSMQSKDHSRIKELETDLETISTERDRLHAQHQEVSTSRGSDSRRFAEIQNELNSLKERANPETLEKMNQEIKTLRVSISREKDRVFVLMTEKQQLEEQLNDVRTNQFKAEQLQSEVNSLRVQVSEYGEWKNDKNRLVCEIETLKNDNDSLTKQLRSEKSQRLVLAARVDELQKFMENADTIIGTTSHDSTMSQRGSLVSSIVPPNEADIPTRRNTIESVVGDFTPTRVVLPGVEPRTVESLKTPEKEEIVLGGESKRSAAVSDSLQLQPTLITKSSTHQPDNSFEDIEQRGSAKKLDHTDERLGSLFGAPSDDGFGLVDIPIATNQDLFVPPPSYSPRDLAAAAITAVASHSPKNDISDIFGGPTSSSNMVDSWNPQTVAPHTQIKPQSPMMKYNVHQHPPPVDPSSTFTKAPSPLSTFQQHGMSLSQGNVFPKASLHHAPHIQPVAPGQHHTVPVSQGNVFPKASVQQPMAPVQVFKPVTHQQPQVPAHSLARPQVHNIPHRGMSPSSSPAATPQPAMPVHPAFGGNRSFVPPQQHQPVQQAHQPAPQFVRPSGFPGSINSVAPPAGNPVHPPGNQNSFPPQNRYGTGPFR